MLPTFKHWLILGCVVAVLAGVGYLEWRHNRELAVKDDAIAAAAKEVGATKADLVSASRLIADLQKNAAATKLIKAGAVPTVSARVVESISDTAKGTEKTEAGAPCPTSWADEYHRFSVDLASGLLTRKQQFSINLTILRDASGKSRYTTTEFREYDPVTGVEIPSTGIKGIANVEVNDEKPPGPGRWHLRGVAAVDARGAVGAGAYAEPLPHVAVGLLGLYSPKNKDFRAALYGGYRLFNTTFAVGPYVGVSSKGGTLVGGVAATLEFTK